MDRGRNRFWSFHNDATGKRPVLENEVLVKEEQNGFLKGKQGKSRVHRPVSAAGSQGGGATAAKGDSRKVKSQETVACF